MMQDESMYKQVSICPQCGGTMEVRFIGPQQDKRAVCSYCRSQIDLPDSDPRPVTTQVFPPYPSYSPQPVLPAAAASKSLATISLIAGIAGVTNLFPLLGPIVAIAVGKRALEKIRTDPEHYRGEKMARMGIWLGYLGLAFGMLVCCIYSALYGMVVVQKLLY